MFTAPAQPVIVGVAHEALGDRLLLLHPSVGLGGGLDGIGHFGSVHTLRHSLGGSRNAPVAPASTRAGREHAARRKAPEVAESVFLNLVAAATVGSWVPLGPSGPTLLVCSSQTELPRPQLFL